MWMGSNGECTRALQWEITESNKKIIIIIKKQIIIWYRHTSKKWYIHIPITSLKIQGALKREKSRQGILISI